MKHCDTVCDRTTLPAPLTQTAPVENDLHSQPALLSRDRSEVPRFVAVLTLILWLGCSVIGALGFAMPYARPQATKAEPEPIQVEMLNVELSNDVLPDLAPPTADPLALPPPADAVAQPQVPQPIAVALPSPAVAFAVPVAAPARIVDVAQASYSSSVIKNDMPVAAAPVVQSLNFGQGAGRQPAPDYPWRAQSEGQEGVVSVRFTVADNGRVAAAEAVLPSPWPMLNDSAVRTIRNRWRFPTGAPRAYEVVIRFVLPK